MIGPVMIDDYQVISLERDRRGWYYIHMDVYYWVPQALRNSREYFDSLSCDLRVNVLPENTKLIKYAALHGFYPSYMDQGGDRTWYLILERTNPWDHFSEVDPPTET